MATKKINEGRGWGGGAGWLLCPLSSVVTADAAERKDIKKQNKIC